MSWVYSFYLGLSLIHLPQLFGNLRLWRESRGGAGPTKKSVNDVEEKTGGDVQLFPWLTMIMRGWGYDDDEAGDGAKMSRGEIVSKALKPICQNSFGQRPKWLSNRWNKVDAPFFFVDKIHLLLFLLQGLIYSIYFTLDSSYSI